MQSVTNGTKKKSSVVPVMVVHMSVSLDLFLGGSGFFRFALLAGLTSQNEGMHSKLKSSYILKVRQRPIQHF